MSASWAIGLERTALPTPALVADLDVVEANIQRIAAACRAGGKAWRPHIKGLRVPALAHKALTAGAIGITCAKLGEAEAMAAAGIVDILIANQIVGPDKLRRVAALARDARMTIAVDSMKQAELLDAAAEAAGTRVGVVIEVDIGIARAGVRPGDVVALARQLVRRDNLEFRGVMGWEGHTCAIADQTAKETAVASAVAVLVEAAQACRAEGMDAAVVSCGGTGTYWITARQPGVTEVQAGGGIFADLRYVRRFGVDHAMALRLMATVTSRPTPTRIVCDAGKKSMNAEAPLSEPLDLGPIKSVTLSAEHVAVELGEARTEPLVGEKIDFAVGYLDMTTHLHETLFGVRNGRVESAWQILPRSSAI